MAGKRQLRTCPVEAGSGDKARAKTLNLLQNGYCARDNAKYLEHVFVFRKPIFSEIKGKAELGNEG